MLSAAKAALLHLVMQTMYRSKPVCQLIVATACPHPQLAKGGARVQMHIEDSGPVCELYVQRRRVAAVGKHGAQNRRNHAPLAAGQIWLWRQRSKLADGWQELRDAGSAAAAAWALESYLTLRFNLASEWL